MDKVKKKEDSVSQSYTAAKAL